MQYLVNLLKLPQTYLDYSFWGNSLNSYLLSLVSLVVVFLIYKFGVVVLRGYFRKVSEKTKNSVDDIIVNLIKKLDWWIYLYLSFYIIIKSITFAEVTLTWVEGAQFLLGVYIVIRGINASIEQGIEYITNAKDNARQKFSVRVMGNIGKAIVWILGIIFILSSFGYNITSLIAGLGIGGIAVALAVQNVLSDILSSVAIHIDKPFRIDDYISVGEQEGTVKYIGIKTTRITSLTGEEVIISNNKLTSEDINNYGRLKERRVAQSLGVTYSTSLAKMKKIPNGVKGLFKGVKEVEFDRCRFKEFGDFSKNFELIYYCSSHTFGEYRERQEVINLKIQEYFEKEKIEFAFPTQTLHVMK